MGILKNKVFKWGGLSLLVIVITGGIVGYKMYNKPHRSVTDAKSIAVTATAIVAQYETDENKANAQYLDKVLTVSGEVTDITKNQKGETVIALKGSDMGGVTGTLEGPELTAVEKGSTVKMQGICTGYLTDVVLVRCFLSNN